MFFYIYMNFSFQVGIKLKQCFQRKIVPQPQIKSVSMLTKIKTSSLLCHSGTMYKEWLKSIKYYMGEHAQTQIEFRKDLFLQFLKDGGLEN